MYPTSTIVGTLIVDRLRDAEAARGAHAAGRTRYTPARRSRPARATIIRLAVLATAGDTSGGRVHVGP